MQRKFLSWLFVLICAAFAVAGALSFLQFQRQSEARAKDLMSSRLRDLMLLVKFSQENMRHVVEINDESTLERTRAAAEIIRLNPAVLDSLEDLQGLCNDLGAAQICVSDKSGLVIAGAPKSVLGYNLAQHEQSRPFLECITSPGFEVIQRPQGNGLNGELIQYAGVTRPDEPGVIQLGFKAQHEQMVRESINFSKLADNILGKDAGHIIAFQEGRMLNKQALNLPTSILLSLPLNKVSEVTLGGTNYATYVIESNGMRLVALMPWREISKISFKSLRYLLLSNIGLFVFMFVIVWLLLRIYVLGGMRRINTALHRITEGYTEERVNEKSTPEFTRLSTGINAMVDAIQSYGEQKRERLQKELQLAGAIQSTVLPSTFPAFPDNPEFDIYATCDQAHSVGGDFYDFFMPDSKHLCFMLGDVAATGIPAALYMMRAISITRELANTGATPQNVLTKANKILCREGADMRLSLFYGRLNIITGDLRFVNAGTPQALRCHNGGQYEMLTMTSGAILGAHAEATYQECRVTLQPGDRLFLHTHGVLAAADVDLTPFGAVRLQEALQADAPTVADVPRRVRAALRQYTREMEQSNDITMLALEFRGKWSIHARKNVTADNPAPLTTMLQEKLESVFAAPDSITNLIKAVGDIMSVLPPETEVEAYLRCNEQEARLNLTYNQPQFNPLIVLPHLPLERVDFRSDNNSSTLKLRQSL